MDMKTKITSEYSVLLEDEEKSVKDLKQAENELRKILGSHSHGYIIRRDYDSKGKLIETYMII